MRRQLTMVLVIGFVALVAFTFAIGYYYDQALDTSHRLVALAESQQEQLLELFEIVEQQKLALDNYEAEDRQSH